jgi:hypothetical protein
MGKTFDHITPILKDIGWLPVKEHLLFKDLVMIYKCINSLAPTYLCDLFLKRKELNNRATRNNEALHIPLLGYFQPQQDKEVFDIELLGYGIV